MAQKIVKGWNPVETLGESIKLYRQMICMLRNARFRGGEGSINAAKERRDTLIEELSESIIKSRRLLVQYNEAPKCKKPK